MDKMTQAQMAAKLPEVGDWSPVGDDALQRTYRFENFVDAMAFVNRVAELAEELQHHPDIMIRYNKVTLTLSTHDAGGVTEKDFGFARAADEHVTA